MIKKITVFIMAIITVVSVFNTTLLANAKENNIDSMDTVIYEKEPNNELKDAEFIELNKMYSGSILGNDDYDYYRVKLDKGITYKIAIDGISQNGDTFVSFCDPQGVDVGVDDFLSTVTFGDGIFHAIDDQNMYYATYTATVTGNYYIEFCNYFGNQNNYSFYVKTINRVDKSYEAADNSLNDIAIISKAPNESCHEVEPNNELKEAGFMSLNMLYIGSILDDDDFDYYRVKLDKGITYKIAIDGISKNGDTYVTLYDTKGMGLGVSDLYSTVAFGDGIFDRLDDQGMYYVTYTPTISGNYYMRFCNYFGNQSNYSFYIKSIKKSSDSNDDKNNKSSGNGVDNNKNNNNKNDMSSGKSKESYSNEWVDGKWYNADGTQTYKGTMKWKKNSKGWWIEDTKGWYPQSQWQKIDGKWYYFCADGYMDYSEYRDGCWLRSDGSWDERYSSGSWHLDSKGWWYSDGNWYSAGQSLWIDGTKYHFNSAGYWDY